MQRIVQISEDEYNYLLDRSDFLDCLEACGVDNWSGYDDAVEMYESQPVREEVLTTTTTSTVSPVVSTSIAIDSGYGYADPLLDVLIAEEIAEEIIEEEEYYDGY